MISLDEIGGQIEPSVLTELHEKSEIVSEGKLLLATRDRRLQRLLDGLLGMEPHRPRLTPAPLCPRPQQKRDPRVQEQEDRRAGPVRCSSG